MNTWTLIGVVAAAVSVIIAAMQWMFSVATKRGTDRQKLDDTHERVKAIDERMAEQEKRIAPLEDTREKVKTYDTKSVECEKRFVKLEERKADNRIIDEIRIDLAFIKKSLPVHDTPFQSQSPVRLTDIGERIVTDTGVYAAINANWPAIEALVDDTVTSTNPYDIQMACFDLALIHLGTIIPAEVMNALKNAAFNEGYPLSVYARIVGIVIRDKYLAQMGIDIADIDKHDPAKQ